MSYSMGHVSYQLECAKCHSKLFLWRAVPGFTSLRKLPDEFEATCGDCGHKSKYKKTAIDLRKSPGG